MSISKTQTRRFAGSDEIRSRKEKTENMNYDEIKAVRRSALWEIRKSPAHYHYMVTHPEEPTPALIFGIAAHKYILEPEDFWNDYALAPDVDRRTKAGKETWAQFLTDTEGKTPITNSDLETIAAMNAAIIDNETAKALLKSGAHEVPIEWIDSETGEPCKCRPDCLTEFNGKKYIVDYKTTTSCEDGAFERSCRYYGYKLQAAMYTEGVFCSSFEQREFAFVAQEKNPPYAVRVYFCDKGFVEEGTEIFRDLMAIYHKCNSTGIWPGYEDRELLGDE